VDSNKKFLNVSAKFAGSTNDSYIWNASDLKVYFDNGTINGILLGDSGYKLRPYMMIPFLNPISSGEEKYNRSHAKTRRVVEFA